MALKIPTSFHCFFTCPYYIFTSWPYYLLLTSDLNVLITYQSAYLPPLYCFVLFSIAILLTFINKLKSSRDVITLKNLFFHLKLQMLPFWIQHCFFKYSPFLSDAAAVSTKCINILPTNSTSSLLANYIVYTVIMCQFILIFYEAKTNEDFDNTLIIPCQSPNFVFLFLQERKHCFVFCFILWQFGFIWSMYSHVV